MQIDTLILKMDNLLAALQSEMPAISDEIALNAIALIKKRIIDDRHGITGAAYSRSLMLATKDQFVVKSAFKQSTIDSTALGLNDGGQAKRKKDGTLFKSRAKNVKRGLWIKFPRASKAVPVMLLEGGYKEFREIQGRPGDHVNLSLTGKMWQGTTITARIQKGYTWVTVIGGGNKEAQDKLTWNTAHYGPFLTVTDDEEKLLNTVFQNRLQKIVNEHLK